MEVKEINERISSGVLGGCIVIALLLLVLFGVNRCNRPEPQPVRITMVVQVDSTGTIVKSSKDAAEKIVEAIEKHDRIVEDKYQYALEQRVNYEDYMRWIGLIVTVILSVLGFFGYKSLHSMEERISESTIKKSSDILESSINEKFKDANKRLSRSITGRLNNMTDETSFKNKVKVIINEQVPDLLNTMPQSKNKENEEKIEELQGVIEKINESLNILRDQVDKNTGMIRKQSSEGRRPSLFAKNAGNKNNKPQNDKQ